MHLTTWRYLETDLLSIVRKDNLSFKFMIHDLKLLAYNQISFCHASLDVDVKATNGITILERESKIT